MFRLERIGSGWSVEGNGGLSFPHGGARDVLRPQIEIKVLSDKVAAREVWLPYDKHLNARLDTGADVTCINSQWMWRLGLKEDRTDVVRMVTVSNGRRVEGRRKRIRIRVRGYHEAIIIPIVYSPKFRDDLFVMSLAAIAPYFGVALSCESAVLFCH